LKCNSYIVRIYRCDAESVVGVVEMPVQERQTPFRTFAELRAILVRESRAPARRPSRNLVKKRAMI
jgi:hypothetical protein